MATIDRKSKAGRNAVDASCEIVVDALYMTTDILHSITNNLPVPMERAQVIERRTKSASGIAVDVKRALLLTIGVVAMMVGAIQIASAFGSAADAPARPANHSVMPPTLGDEAREFLAQGQPAEALAAVEFAAAQGIVDADLREVRVQALLEMGDYPAARSASLGAVADGLGPDFVALYRQSLEDDPALAYDPRPLEVSAFEIVERDDTRMVVEQDGVKRTLDLAGHDDDRWAVQLSAVRLCAAIACAFDMPATEHVTLTRADVSTLGLDAEPLDWRYGVGESGEFVEVVDAALTEVVDTTSRFPVEFTRTWRNPLSVDVDESYVDAPFAATIEPLAGNGEWASKVLAQRGETDTRQFARQMGSMIAFDFLTNHYARFESNERRYGAHVGWLDGKMVSIDHTDAFAERQSRRVSDRFEWMTRMPAETATAIELMAPEVIDARVLVGLSTKQREVFWQQQERFVERLSELESAHGRSHVRAL